MIPGFEQVQFWYWWIVAGLVLILELTHPAFLFLWVGIAAALVGFLLLLFPGMPLAGQFAVFGSLSAAALALFRR